MDPIKIVVRYNDGRTVKGFTQDFFPNKPNFHLYLADPRTTRENIDVALNELKAIFFVRDFAGDPDYRERKHLIAGERVSGRVVEVSFTDGETMVGATLGYDPQRAGFFLFPLDPEGNNLRVFAVSAAVKQVRFLT